MILDDLERHIQGLPKLLKYPYYLIINKKTHKIYGLQIWPIHSQSPFE